MIKHLLLFCLLIHAINGAAIPPKKKWLTLHGGEPLIVANGGMSGIYPGSSWGSYAISIPMSTAGSALLCDLKLTKDNFAYCLSKMVLQNTSNVAEILPDLQRTYDVNGEKVTGWFGVDIQSAVLFQNITLIQNTFTRPSYFDNEYGVTPPEALEYVGKDEMVKVFINVEYDMFYKQHKLDVESYVEEMVKTVKVNFCYISSPEIGFLKAIRPKLPVTVKTKLLFKFPSDVNHVEPSTKEKYGSLLKKLNTIKSFAAGILVPKEYIWPVNEKRYLEPATTLVTDAHKLGLEVFAYGFSNDFYIAYNYSLDPVNEYLQFVDNSHFSVDGVVTDFCITASNAIACLAHNKNASRVLKKLVISHNGASGDYPGATDLAYQKAVDDGVDIIDCNVQLTKDGVAFCQDSADLKLTTSAGSEFMDKMQEITEVNGNEPGIFSFELTWEEIKSLKPRISSPYDAPLDRNPAYQFAGKFMTLPEFLEFAKAKAVGGILIGIENAGYLSTRGHDIIATVTSALTNSSFNNQTKQRVMITSDETAVLSKFKNNTKYETVLEIRKDVSSVPPTLVAEIRKYADAVSVRRNSLVLLYGDPFYVTRNFTSVVRAMKAVNLTVYISSIKNEFQSFLFDYSSDPYQEIATLLSDEVDGLITDFPATAVAYMRSPCSDLHANLPYSITPVSPGHMFKNDIMPIIQHQGIDPKTINTTDFPPLTPKDIKTEAIPPVAEGPSAASPDTPSNSDSDSNNTPAAPSKDSSSKTLAPTSSVLFLVALAGMLLTLSF